MAASSLRSASDEREFPTWTVAELIRAATAGPAIPESMTSASGTAADKADDTWAQTLGLVEDAAAKVLGSEKRMSELESANRELEARLSDEVGSLRARMEATKALVQRSEAALEAAEERARKAEDRAAAAEGWLARIREQALLIRRG